MQATELFIDEIAKRVVEVIRFELDFNNKIFANKLTFDEREAAEILGVPVHVLKACRERGEICPRKIGKKWHYNRDQLIAFSAAESV